MSQSNGPAVLRAGYQGFSGLQDRHRLRSSLVLLRSYSETQDFRPSSQSFEQGSGEGNTTSMEPALATWPANQLSGNEPPLDRAALRKVNVPEREAVV
ncbi:hypothetical protein DL767_010285 [Monosporascus sp. MG133]|nr:hypothetical protein DL767_010285 [Monosporascus sp. MG133]